MKPAPVFASARARRHAVEKGEVITLTAAEAAALAAQVETARATLEVRRRTMVKEITERTKRLVGAAAEIETTLAAVKDVGGGGNVVLPAHLFRLILAPEDGL